MQNERTYDYSISFSRFIAMVFVFSCHIMQFYQLEFAWWFNVGVQMFLFISGYLYGNINNKKIKKFYRKNLEKILIDYYIYIVCVLLILGFAQICLFDIFDILKLLTCTGTINGLGHLWYIRYIIVCYFLTPFFSLLLDNYLSRDKIRNFGLCLVILALIELIFDLTFSYFKGAWINCYFLGIVIRNSEDKRCDLFQLWHKVIIVLCIVMNSVQIILEHVFIIEFTGIKRIIFSIWCKYAHVFLGICLVMITRHIFKKFMLSEKRKIMQILNWSDKYSYDVYLTHHIYILGPVAILDFFEYPFWGIIFILVLTVISAVALRRMAQVVKYVGGKVEEKRSFTKRI